MTDKQTAVEWLEERINIGLTYEQDVLFEGLFEQAKEMEKEQIFKTSRYFFHELGNLTPIQYYNETFKNTNKCGQSEM